MVFDFRILYEAYLVESLGKRDRFNHDRYTYELEETAAPKGYQKLSAPLTVSVADDGTMTITCTDAEDEALIDVQYENGQKSGVLTITDKPESLTLRKVDADGNPLRNAVFTLYQFDRVNNRKYTTSEYTGLTSDENGVFFGDNLRSGYYLLEDPRKLGLRSLSEKGKIRAYAALLLLGTALSLGLGLLLLPVWGALPFGFAMIAVFHRLLERAAARFLPGALFSWGAPGQQSRSHYKH